jgi:hypothetical protein
MVTAVETMQTADVNSTEFEKAYTTFEKLTADYLDLAETKAYLKNNLSDTIGNVFSFAGAILDEIDTIGTAYQYVCWAESYAETSAAFKIVLTSVAEKAEKKADQLDFLHKYENTPYTEASMCRGLSTAIYSFLDTMESYAEDSHKAFVSQVLNKTANTTVSLTAKLISGKAKKLIGGSICPELAGFNLALSSGKTFIDLFTNVDDESKWALSIESLNIIADLLVDVSDSYGNALKSYGTFSKFESLIGKNADTEYICALEFDESIKMYKNAMQLACDYGIKYENSKLSHDSQWAYLLQSDGMPTLGIESSRQRQANMITLLTLQKTEISNIQCHEENSSLDAEEITDSDNNVETEAFDVWMDYLKSGDYKEDTSDGWNPLTHEYTITDINDDNIPELLIETTTDAPFYNTWCFAIFDGEIRCVFETYGYGCFRYSPTYNAIIGSPETAPFLGNGYLPFYELVGTDFVCIFEIGKDEGNNYFSDSSGKITITDEEYSSYYADAIEFSWEPVSAVLEDSSSDKINLATYLGTNIYDFAEKIGGSAGKDGTDGSIAYSQDGVYVAQGPGEDFISYIELDVECEYSIVGIECGMSMEEATIIAMQNEAQVKTDESYCKSFELSDDTVITLYSQDGENVESVVIYAVN